MISKPYKTILKSEPLRGDEAIAAGEAVRTLEKSPAWGRICRELEVQRDSAHRLLYANVDNTSRERLAEATGVVKMVEQVYSIFDQVLKEAQQAREQYNRGD